MPQRRRIVSSDGCEFHSMYAAAKVLNVAPSQVSAAVRATECGRFSTIQGLQFAYAEKKPDVWPISRFFRKSARRVVETLSAEVYSVKSRGNYTTGQVAKICHLSQQTIIRCFDSGLLKGFYVPGSTHRRIPCESLISFMQANNIPNLQEKGND